MFSSCLRRSSPSLLLTETGGVFRSGYSCQDIKLATALSNAQVQNGWRYTSAPSIRLHGFSPFESRHSTHREKRVWLKESAELRNVKSRNSEEAVKCWRCRSEIMRVNMTFCYGRPWQQHSKTHVKQYEQFDNLVVTYRIFDCENWGDSSWGSRKTAVLYEGNSVFRTVT